MKLKTVYLQSKVTECLTNARLCLASRVPARNFHNQATADQALAHLHSALAFARQLPDCPTYRVERAHLVAAIEAWHD